MWPPRTWSKATRGWCRITAWPSRRSTGQRTLDHRRDLHRSVNSVVLIHRFLSSCFTLQSNRDRGGPPDLHGGPAGSAGGAEVHPAGAQQERAGRAAPQHRVTERVLSQRVVRRAPKQVCVLVLPTKMEYQNSTIKMSTWFYV